MRTYKNIIVTLIIILSITANTSWAKAKKTGNVPVAKDKIVISEYLPKLAPEAEFFDSEGNKHVLEEFDGTTILLTLWATWCSICTNELPELDRLQKDFRKKPFKIIPVSQDFKGIDVVKEFYQKNNIKHLPIYSDTKNNLFKAFSIVGLPTSIIIDPDGNEVARISGSVNWYDQTVRDLLTKYIRDVPGGEVITLPKVNDSTEKDTNKPKVKEEKPIVPTKKELPADAITIVPEKPTKIF